MHGVFTGERIGRREVGHDVIPNQGGALLVGRVISGHDAIHAYKALGVWELGKNKLENPQTVVMRRLQLRSPAVGARLGCVQQ